LIVYGCQFVTSDYAFRLPLILQAFTCVIVMSCVFFIPESPRWQMANGMEKEAMDFLIKYHGNGNPESRLVKLEIEEMKEGIRLDGIDKNWWDCEYLPAISSRPEPSFTRHVCHDRVTNT
jgi:hypothetical protein